MTLSVARPDAADLVLQSYGRTLHPDLLCQHKSAQLNATGMVLELHLIPSGHAFILRTARQVLTEVISDRRDAYPVRGRLFEQRLKGSTRSETVEFESGLRYDVCCTLEIQPLAIFLRQHEELVADGARASLFVEFPSANRFSPGAVSVIQAEICRGSVIIHSFHTYPEQLAIVKTQSLIELRRS